MSGEYIAFFVTMIVGLLIASVVVTKVPAPVSLYIAGTLLLCFAVLGMGSAPPSPVELRGVNGGEIISHGVSTLSDYVRLSVKRKAKEVPFACGGIVPASGGSLPVGL